jgi:phospholipid/cholesterol/gamma-HCH transport system substrate-binding protein
VKRAIKDHLRDFVALLFLFVIALGVGGYILSNQRFNPPGWVPLVGQEFYELQAELSTAQAVVPGQGQTVNIAGVKVGDIGEVRLEDGRAVVEMLIDEEHAPVHRDATILLRPKTGLKDMFLELDPGTRSAGALREGERIQVSNTLPDVNPDEVLAQLDGDTRAYLRVLLNSGAEALDGEGSADLRETFKRFEPTARDGARITRLLAQRRGNVKRVIHNFQELATELGTKDRQLAELVSTANANFDAISNQDAALRQALRRLPGTLGQTRTTLTSLEALSGQLGPALSKLRPGARALGPSLRQTRPFLRATTPAIRDQIRPFARDVRPTVRDLRRTASDVSVVTPRLTNTFAVLNTLFDTLAHNPRGSEEGFLFWLSWLNHAGATIFGQSDAHGIVRRGLVLVSCPALNTLNLGVRPNNPQLDAITELTNLPEERVICPNNPQTTITPGAGASSTDGKGEVAP